MFGGRLLNSIVNNSIKILIKILQSQKKYPKNQYFIPLLEQIAKIFNIFSSLDSKIYYFFLKIKKEKKLSKEEINKITPLLNYVPLISIKFAVLLLILITHLKIPKSLKVDIQIIKNLILTSIKGNISLIKENIKNSKNSK